MAICDDLLAQRNSIKSELNSLDSEKNRLNLTAANESLYQANLDKARTIISTADNLRDVIAQLQSDVEKNQCTKVSGLGILISIAGRITRQTEAAIDVLNENWQKTQEQLAQEQQEQETQPYPDPEPESSPQEGDTPPPSEGDNQANDDASVSTEGGTTGASDPTNASQDAQAARTAGTEQSDNPNLEGKGNAQSNAATNPTDAPGRRLKNPLGSLSSYNYQLSLYMITPDAYDAFVASGRKDIDALANGGASSGGAYLIAQSGGINNNTSRRAPGFDLDYYIDNVKIKQALGGESTQSATNTYDINFTIVEPYGFSFVTKLRQVSDALIQYSNDSGYSKGGLENPTKQLFILGIKFLGYDAEGNIVTGDKDFEGQALDPNTSNEYLFQTYYDILFTGIKFKIEGSATTYNITCGCPGPGTSFGTKRGRLLANRTVTASTFEEALSGENGLFTQMNQHQANLVAEGAQEFPNEYRVEFIGPDIDALRTATLITPEDVDKGKWPTPDIENAEESTDAEAAKATPDNTKRQIVFNQGTSLIEVFDELVKSSTYLRDALKVVYENNPTPDESRTQPENKPASNKKIAWYHVTSQLSNAKWDPKIADWAYVTTFRIETYQTPVIISSTVNPGMAYYGPHKRYEYWYTGENREILEYTQQLDNLYYNEVLGETPDEDGVGTGGSADTPSVPGQQTAEPKFNSLGGGREAQNNYVTSLYSPDAYATAKIKVMGDPDFLVQESRGDINTVYQRFYGDDGFRVNANGGQVFMEIDFKEAVDYNTTTGTMDINDSILFFKYPDSISKKIKGVSYKIITLTSQFSDGRFVQEIEAAINTFPDPEVENQEERAESEGAAAGASGEGTTRGAAAGASGEGTATADGRAATGNTGLTKDPDFVELPGGGEGNGTAPPSPLQPSADDDAGSVALPDGGPGTGNGVLPGGDGTGDGRLPEDEGDGPRGIAGGELPGGG